MCDHELLISNNMKRNKFAFLFQTIIFAKMGEKHLQTYNLNLLGTKKRWIALFSFQPAPPTPLKKSEVHTC